MQSTAAPPSGLIVRIQTPSHTSACATAGAGAGASTPFRVSWSKIGPSPFRVLEPEPRQKEAY